DSGDHLLKVINDILDLSKIEAGKTEFVAETFRVEELIRDVARSVGVVAEANGNQLETTCPEGLGEMHADPVRVRQCLINIVSNACKFSKNSTVNLEAERETIDGRDWLAFRVRDRGIGMSPDQVERLFQPFTQADVSTSRKYGGTGLGLAITRMLCERMGGTMDVESAQGVGSTFRLRFPARQLDDNDRGTLHMPSLPCDDAETRIQGDQQSECVLVIDDEETTRRLISRFLVADGWSVATAASGEEGIRLAKILKPVAVTLDVMMPDTDGWETLRRFKSDPELRDVPVIMATIVDDRNAGFTLGAADYLNKPIDRENLLRVLAKHCSIKETGVALVAEDDPVSREIVVRMLRNEGWEVLQAENGEVALELLADRRPQVILLDLMMPKMDGFEFLRRMRENESWAELPVIVVTARSLSDSERDELAESVHSIVRKEGEGLDALLGRLQSSIQECSAAQEQKNKPTPENKPETAPEKENPATSDITDSSTPNQPAEPSKSSEPSADPAKDDSAPTVLLAEDNKFNQRLAIRMLTKMGRTAHVAENGAEAVKAWESQAFDLILMDVQMPEM
ncbi:MAG: response regulator, partial [Planctomycetales bacterium]